MYMNVLKVSTTYYTTYTGNGQSAVGFLSFYFIRSRDRMGRAIDDFATGQLSLSTICFGSSF